MPRSGGDCLPQVLALHPCWEHLLCSSSAPPPGLFGAPSGPVALASGTFIVSQEPGLGRTVGAALGQTLPSVKC